MTWKEVLQPIKESDYFKNLWEKVKLQYNSTQCFPPKDEIFRALELTEFDDVEVVGGVVFVDVELTCSTTFSN